ncbi:hypothetical protein D3C84_1199530 [compost metagenome]
MGITPVCTAGGPQGPLIGQRQQIIGAKRESSLLLAGALLATVIKFEAALQGKCALPFEIDDGKPRLMAGLNVELIRERA